MKWYTIFCGEDFSDHSVGLLNEDFNGDSFDTSDMIYHAKEIAKNKAWLVLSLTDIHPETHTLSVSTVWEYWAPLKKKIVLDPKKGKIKKSKTIDQMLMSFQDTAPPAGVNIPMGIFEQLQPQVQGTIILDDVVEAGPPEEF